MLARNSVALFGVVVFALFASAAHAQRYSSEDLGRTQNAPGDLGREPSMSVVADADPNADSAQASAPAKTGEASAAEGEDRLTEHQSVDTFLSLEDGQPGSPGELEAELLWGWQAISTHKTKGPLKGETENSYDLEAEIEYTLKGSDFLNNTQLILAAPLTLGEGRVDGNGDVTFGWQQRWIKDNGAMPTLSTLAEIRTPSGDQSSGVDGTLTGIAAKEMGPGTLFLNGFVKTANGNNIEDVRHFQWGVRAGYKWRLSEQLAIVGDYSYQSSIERGHGDVDVLEVGAEYHVSDHLTIGPGIQIGLDDNEETPDVGAGLLVKYSF